MGQTQAKKRRWPGVLVRIGLFLLIGLIVWALAVLGLQRRVLFPRHNVPKPGELTAGEVRETIEVWHHQSPAGAVEAWFMPAAEASANRPRPAVIFAHGNAELIDHWVDQARRYREMGLHVLMPEYRGYGRSAGSPSQKAIVTDFTAFYDRLAAREEVDGDRIVFHGRSLGGGVTAQLAKRRRPAAWVLESSFTSAAALARQFGVPRLLMRDPFDVLPVVRAYDGPVLILHGTTDEIVPLAHARRLHEAAEQSELITHPVTHNEPFPDEAFWGDVEQFLGDAGILETKGAAER